MTDIAPIPDSHRDLLAAPVVGALTTNGPGGYPQTTAIWFVLEGDRIVTSLHRTRQKYKNMVADPHATLFLVDPANPFRTVEVRADVEMTPSVGTELLERMLPHYGSDLDHFPVPTDNRVDCVLIPRRIVTNG